MTEVLILNEDQKIREIRIKGHTQYARKGEDIVCASLSFLIQSCSAYFQEKKIPVNETREKDTIILRVNEKEMSEADPEVHKIVENFLEYIVYSLRLLGENYKKHISINERNV